MVGPQNDSNLAGARSRRGMFAVQCAVLFALFGLAISNHASPTLISDAVQAEYAASNMASPAPMQLAQPAVVTRTEREN